MTKRKRKTPAGLVGSDYVAMVRQRSVADFEAAEWED